MYRPSATPLQLLALCALVALGACSDETAPLAPEPTAPVSGDTSLAVRAGSRSRIAFSAKVGGVFEIFVVAATGGTPVRLTWLEGFSYDPAISPDGRLIVFASYVNGFPELLTMRKNGRSLKQITHFQSDQIVGTPAWSPDGSRIAFARQVDNNYDVYVMQADGSGVTRLTESDGVDWQPVWSPDGTRIAFTSNRDGSFDVYTMSAEGDNEAAFTTCLNSCFSPAWSPDGRQIALQSGTDLRLQGVTGGVASTIATGLTERATPAWSPDGSELAFVTTGAGQPDIFAARADGTGRRRITNTPEAEESPSWGR